jgi:hypothetical protein
MLTVSYSIAPYLFILEAAFVFTLGQTKNEYVNVAFLT